MELSFIKIAKTMKGVFWKERVLEAQFGACYVCSA